MLFCKTSLCSHSEKTVAVWLVEKRSLQRRRLDFFRFGEGV